MGVLTLDGFSPGSDGPSCVVIIARAVPVAATCASAAFSSPSSAGVTAADNAPSRLALPSALSVTSLSALPAVFTSPAMRFTPALRAELVASHGSDSTCAAVLATPPMRVVDTGTAVEADLVTLSMDSRCLERSAAAPVMVAPPPPTHPLDESKRRRCCFCLKLASCWHAPDTRPMAASGPPALMAASALPSSAAVAAVAASLDQGRPLVGCLFAQLKTQVRYTHGS